MNEKHQISQKILTNTTVGGNLTTGSITQNIFNTPPPLDGNPFAPPQIREGGLFGRNDELAELHRLLQSGKNVCVVAGMGGVGKTELVRQYADTAECKSHFTGGVFYIDARNRQDLAAEIVAWTKWKFQRELSPKLSPVQMVTACWEVWSGQTDNVLLILDDITDLAKQFKPYLPPHNLKNLRLLLTSRDTPDQQIAEKLELKTLRTAAALELLGSIIGIDRVEQEQSEAELLCEELGYLPLALELVGYYLAEGYQDLSLAAMRGKLAAKVKHPSLSPEQVPLGMRALRGMQAAFDLSWEELKPEAQYLAVVLGAFAAAPIHWDFVTGLYSDLSIEMSHPDDLKDRWLKSLRKLHLVIDVDINVYDLHPLVRDYLGEQLKQHSSYSSIKQSFCDVLAVVASNIEQSSSLAIFNLVEPHLKKLLAWCEGNKDTQFILSLDGLAVLYYSQGRYTEAEPLYVRSLAIREEQLGANHPHTATSLNNLAGLYQAMGRYAEAEPLYGRSLAITEEKLGANHPHTATSLNNLAELYQSMGRYAEGEPLLVRSLAITEEQLGANHPRTATSLNNLAGLYQAMGRYTEAEPLYGRSLAITEEQLGANHPDTATSLNNLAGLYQAMGRYAEGEPLYVRSLAITEEQLGANHPDTATSLNNLAILYGSTGKYAEAEPLYVRSLAIREEQLGANHPDTATSLNNLALLYGSTGKYAEAEPLYVRSLAIIEEQLGANHPHTASSLNNLALLYGSTGKYAEAEPLYVRSLAIREEQLGANHPDTANSLNNLAGLYESTGKYSEAEPLYARALQICEQSLGIGHPTTINVRGNYAKCLRSKTKSKNMEVKL
jgi:tetratricopeptide (TPR) repeat protein